jgi:hypothetical protein
MSTKKIVHLAIAKELYENHNKIGNKISKSEWLHFVNNQFEFMWLDATIEGQELFNFKPELPIHTEIVACYNNKKNYFNLHLSFLEDFGYILVRYTNSPNKEELHKLIQAANQLQSKLISNYTDVINYESGNV